MKRLFWLSGWLGLSSVVLGSGLEIQLQHPSVTQAQTQQVRIQARFPQIPTELVLSVPPVKNSVKELHGPEWSAQGPGYRATWTLTLLNPKVGPTRLPPIHLDFKTDKGKASWASEAQTYPVTETPGFKQPIRYLPPPEPRFNPWPLAGLLGLWLALSGGGLFWFRSRGPSPRSTSKTAVQQTLDEIKQLWPLHRSGRNKEVHEQLSIILRNFIEAQFHLPAKGQTTEEFLSLNRHSNKLPPQALTALEAYFRLSDQIKFAQLQPEENSSEEALKKMQTLVESQDDLL